MKVIVTQTEQVGEVKKVTKLEIVFDDELGITIEEGNRQLVVDLTFPPRRSRVWVEEGS